jgi:hypothetical protein
MAIFGADHTDLDHARDPTAEELERVERLTPVELKLGAALAQIPRAIQRKGLPLVMIQAQIKGRKKGCNCATGELADALRRRGWQYRRAWEGRYQKGVKTLWYPPGVCPVKESIAARYHFPVGRPPKWLATARRLAEECGYPL